MRVCFNYGVDLRTCVKNKPLLRYKKKIVMLLKLNNKNSAYIIVAYYYTGLL